MGALTDFLGGVGRSVSAGTLGAPVDLTALALNSLIAGGGYAGHKLGLLQEPPSLIEKPVGGSEWMAEKLRNMGLLKDNPGSTGDNWGQAAGSLIGPLTAAKAPQIAGGLLRAADNLAAPQTLNSQAGMIRIPGRGQIPETRGDVNKLADRLAGLLDDAKVDYTADKSSLSPARYFIFDKPGQSAEDVTNYGSEKMKVRISDHKNVHGADYSVDPNTGMTFEEMLNGLRSDGIPIAARVKPSSSGIVPDSFIEKFLGKKVSEISPDYLDQIRNNFVLDKRGGYWKDKRW